MSSTHGIIPTGRRPPWGVPARVGASDWRLGPFVAGMDRVRGSIVIYGGAVGYDAVLLARETFVTAGDARPKGLKFE